MALFFDVTLTTAQLQALTNSTYYWISQKGDGTGLLTSVGGSALAATAAVPAPGDHARVDVSMWQAVEMFITHGALTSAVGGKVSVADLSPDDSLGTSAGTCVVFGTTTDQALAASAESLILPVSASPTSRKGRIAVAILFTTVPTAGAGIRIMLKGHRDGQDRQRG